MDQPAYGTPDGTARPGDEWTVEERLRDQAVRNLRRRAAFRIHLVVYVLVNAALVVTWLGVAVGTGFWHPWFVYTLVGWGIGLGAHGWTAYHPDELSEARIRAEMDRIAGR